MPKITPGNHLFFYQLLSTEMGMGKQVPISRVGEVLSEADVLLDDVECESLEEFVGALDFLKVTTFKKGRVFATVMQRDDLDQLLEKAAQPAVDKEAAAAGKSWKKSRRSKDVHPVKPRHKRVQRKATESVGQEAGQAPALGPVEQVPAVEVAPGRVAVQDERPNGTEGGSSRETSDEGLEAVATATQEVATEPPSGLEGDLTTQDKAPSEPSGKAGEAGPGENAAQGEGVVPDQVPPAVEQPVKGASASEPSISFNITYVPEPESQREQAPEETDARQAASVPVADVGPEEGPSAPEPQPRAGSRRPSRYRPLTPIRLPERISDEVFLPDALLRQIYLALPPKVGLLDTLDESWDFAREAGTITGGKARLSFPLSRSIEGEPPIEVTIERASRLASGKHWQLVHVISGDGDEADLRDARDTNGPEA